MRRIHLIKIIHPYQRIAMAVKCLIDLKLFCRNDLKLTHLERIKVIHKIFLRDIVSDDKVFVILVNHPDIRFQNVHTWKAYYNICRLDQLDVSRLLAVVLDLKRLLMICEKLLHCNSLRTAKFL